MENHILLKQQVLGRRMRDLEGKLGDCAMQVPSARGGWVLEQEGAKGLSPADEAP